MGKPINMEEAAKMDKTVEMEEFHKEIDLIQSCINRMAQNSFLIKGWTVTLFAVILALVPEKLEQPNRIFLGVVMLAISIMFWYLDSFFLATERNYRAISDWILRERPKGNRQLLYELNFKAYESEKKLPRTSIGEAAGSNTLKFFYGIPTIISTTYFIFQLCQLFRC